MVKKAKDKTVKVKKKRLKQSELEQFGASPRSYDSVSETDSEESKKIIAGVMRWRVYDPRKPFKESGVLNKIAEGLVERGFGFQNMEGTDANNIINALGGDLKPQLSKAGGNVLVKLYHNVRDVFARRRVKTALTITGTTLAGAALGAAIGAAIIPLIGGAPGAIIGAIAGAMGGAVGLGVLGAVGGGFLGKLFTDRVFKTEKHYQITTRKTNAIKKHYDIGNRTLLTMNAYLYNRAKASSSPICKNHYEAIRKKAMKGEYEAIKAAANFFCYELILLHSEIQKHGDLDNKALPPASLYKDIDTVRNILMKLQKANLSFDLIEYIETVLKVYDVKTIKDDLTILEDSKRTVEFEPPKPPLRRRVLITDTSRPEPEISDMSLDMSKYKNLNENTISDTLVNEFRQIAKNVKNGELTIVANGDEKIAVQLMAAALKAGLKPQLDEKEFPKQSDDERKRRHNIIQKAYKLVGAPPPPEEKKKFGFRFIKE